MQIPRLQPRQGDSEGQESLASTGHKALTWCQGEHRGPGAKVNTGGHGQHLLRWYSWKVISWDLLHTQQESPSTALSFYRYKIRGPKRERDFSKITRGGSTSWIAIPSPPASLSCPLLSSLFSYSPTPLAES